MHVVLIGMKHCGKSTLGAELARRWGCPFHDVDAMIEADYHCQTGQRLSVREIFNRRGEPFFRTIEGQVVCELYLKFLAERPAERPIGRPDAQVIALGGRTALNETICELLRDAGLLVYLQVDPRELLARVKRSGWPDFLDKDDPEGDFLALCRQWHPYYQRQAALTVTLGGLSVARAADELEKRIRQEDPGRAGPRE
jgi:shikimate kinase